VVSDCTHELPAFWDRLAVAPLVDATVFSVLVGRRKPHASLYRAVCRQLGVTPSRALYVGDGGSNELSGARSVGIQAIRLVAPDAIDALVYDAEEDWSGPVIESLGALIEESAPDPTNGEWRPPAGAGR
jgi:putative hydrolase of the HAD superfamily